MAARLVEKEHFSAKGLIQKVKEPPTDTQGRPKEISITDCLTSALAIFKMKFPSLLQFEEEKQKEHIKQNLINLFGLENIPCDTYIDLLSPNVRSGHRTPRF